MEIGSISRLRRQHDYYLNEAPPWMHVIWPRKNSFSWFLKNHRSRLRDEGALIRLGRDYFVDAERFADVARAILFQSHHLPQPSISLDMETTS